MADDFENTWDVGNMTDEEVAQLVREQLDSYSDLDADGIDVQVQDGTVTLSGRVGTEAELQVMEQLLTDVLGLQDVANELVVDELTRQQQDDAADVANAALYAAPRGQRGGANRTEDSAAHLLDDTGAEQYGTQDMGEAIERGYSYNPPSSPVQEGVRDSENH
ncbi:MAG TPA: BON domain-containing protein [Longimicrobiales bacterium]|nr:BON domain-containing protein [Longimicrobiales bacterium]